MIYRIGVCDDEVLHVKVNGLYIKEIAKRNKFEVSIAGFTKASQVLDYLKKDELDILFLDIDLGNESGIMLAAKLTEMNPDLVIIFITGHREFANEAFDVEAMGYIVKPVEEHKAERMLKKAILQVTALRGISTNQAGFVITEENIKKKINEEEIIFIERQLSKSIIHTAEKEYKVYETITSLCERLGKNFLRINQSEVVNMKEIKEIRDNYVYLKNDHSVSIGRTYRKDVMEKYFSN